MRLLHPKTLEIAASRDDIPKTVISHCWSEIFKFKASSQKHPKMFIDDDYILGIYLCLVFQFSMIKGCNFDEDKIKTLPRRVQQGYYFIPNKDQWELLYKYFDDNYLFSDACSLYYKGINIFSDIFPDNPEKYIPVISHREIIRQCNKTINKKDYV